MITNKIICDRCGREMRVPECARVTVAWYEQFVVDSKRDLCAACVAELLVWIEEGKGAKDA